MTRMRSSLKVFALTEISFFTQMLSRFQANVITKPKKMGNERQKFRKRVMHVWLGRETVQSERYRRMHNKLSGKV